MKLLLDENLSPALVELLDAFYSDTAHVRDVELEFASDRNVWAYAARAGYTIVTKDADFHHRSFLFGFPPRVIWIRPGNCSTSAIAELLIVARRKIEHFRFSPDSAPSREEASMNCRT